MGNNLSVLATNLLL